MPIVIPKYQCVALSWVGLLLCHNAVKVCVGPCDVSFIICPHTGRSVLNFHMGQFWLTASQLHKNYKSRVDACVLFSPVPVQSSVPFPIWSCHFSFILFVYYVFSWFLWSVLFCFPPVFSCPCAPNLSHLAFPAPSVFPAYHLPSLFLVFFH